MKNASSDPRLFYPGRLLVLHVWMAGAQLGADPGIPEGGRLDTDRRCAVPIQVEPGCRGIRRTAGCERPYLQLEFSRYLSVSTWRGRRLFEAKEVCLRHVPGCAGRLPFRDILRAGALRTGSRAYGERTAVAPIRVRLREGKVPDTLEFAQRIRGVVHQLGSLNQLSKVAG